MWGMLNSEGEPWISRLVIFMLLIVVGCQILPATFRIFTYMDHVHTTQIHIIVLAIAHHGDNFPIFYMSRWTSIFPVRGMNQILISTPNWNNHSNFSWQVATGNYAPQSYGLHHPKYLQSDNSSSNPSKHNYPPKQSSLEETLKEFMQLTDQFTSLASQEPSLEDTLKAFI